MSNLFPGERLEIQARPPDDPLFGADQSIDDKYVRGEIRIITEQARYPLPSIPALIASGNYKLNPEFQRRHRWDPAKQSRLIESFIMNVPIPPIFLYEDSYSHYEVMDGLQRITAIQRFYNNTLKLEGLVEWPELNDRTYSELPNQVRRGVDRRYLSSIILLQETAKSAVEAQWLKQLVFERINSGGIKLEPQESRNAVYNGPLNQLCIQLARDPHLCRMWSIPEPDAREQETGEPRAAVLRNDYYSKMKDAELVLRFFAYRQRLQHHRGALEDYLDLYLKHGNTFGKRLLGQFERLFSDTTKLVFQVFGKNAFLLYRRRNDEWRWFKRPTTVVYDPLMYVFSQHLHRADALVSRRDAIKDAIKRMYMEKYDEFEGRYTNLANVRARNDLFHDLVASHLR